ncbi:DUF6193 family natural product biosynthesis protein [Streptomyces sp. NPDC048717]|uniref:DUF6193 family natural product biosynthesis protein n=1 Tax=Streptomyces sp. NPDC048717 TaxID=3154928 RepID=UPI0034292D61
MSDIVEAKWNELLTPGGGMRVSESPLHGAFAELIRVAHAEPGLRRFFPWTGMWELHLSRCTRAPYTWDIPYIGILRSDAYYVEGPSRLAPRIIETHSPYEAVAAVLDRLPPHEGPAFTGTADQLAAFESPQEDIPTLG